jgi:hypothetical protein
MIDTLQSKYWQIISFLYKKNCPGVLNKEETGSTEFDPESNKLLCYYYYSIERYESTTVVFLIYSKNHVLKPTS